MSLNAGFSGPRHQVPGADSDDHALGMLDDESNNDLLTLKVQVSSFWLQDCNPFLIHQKWQDHQANRGVIKLQWRQ